LIIASWKVSFNVICKLRKKEEAMGNHWKKILVAVAAMSALWSVSAIAEHANHEHGDGTQNKVSVEAPAECQLCGMDRSVFNYSRAIVTFEDGSSTATCSINCAYEAVTRNQAKKIRNIQVADYATKKLIDAKKAAWVVGGKKRGVMSSIAKWAFSKKKDAENYVKEFGGKVTGFDEAWKASAQ
jgi:nitrous oxide reductase accessory protein NosL